LRSLEQKNDSNNDCEAVLKA